MAGSSVNLGGWTQGLCLRGTEMLSKVANGADPMSKTHIQGTLDYYSDVRALHKDLQRQIDTGDGSRNEGDQHSKEVRLVYTPRFDPANARTTFQDSCAAGTEDPPCEEVVETTREIQSQIIRIPSYQIRRLCEPVVSDYTAAKTINKLIMSTEKRLSDEMNTVLAANIGQFEDNSLSKSYRLINNTTGAVWGLGEAELRTDLMDSRYNGMINIIGAGNWQTYRQLSGIGGLADTGILTQNLADWSFYYDTDLAGKLATTNNALTVEVGATHLISWNAFRGKYLVASDERVRTTVSSPFTPGLIWDLVMDKTYCTTGKNPYDVETWDVRVMLAWDIWTMPNDVYSSGDVLDNVNGIFNVVGTDA